ncbi:MAG: hypothetical protein GOVbin212_29 [Prokaryotic dsDNA virus sp.]|nr:MAG: hypothetical protein GOVbin212_29 [Prokaryotic dsDNA virus sp.]
MLNIPQPIINIAEKYKLKLPTSQKDMSGDFWCIGKNYIIFHDALTKIAKIEGIVFHKPQVEILYNDNNFFGVAMMGEAELDGYKIWTSADSTKENTMAKYYFNMAEKRLRDRQVLKLLDLYEYGLYSDVEADAFKKQPTQSIEAKPMTKYQGTQIVEILKHQEGYNVDKVKAIFKNLSHEEAKDVLEHFHSGRIDEAVDNFYKLYKESK